MSVQSEQGCSHQDFVHLVHFLKNRQPTLNHTHIMSREVSGVSGGWDDVGGFRMSSKNVPY